jgi:hypothetical protein
MHTTGIITESAYRSLVEFRVKRKKGSAKPQALTDGAANRLYYIIVLFPASFFLVSHFVFHIGLVAAATIALLWFLSFFLAGLLYHRGIVSVATKRPSVPDIDKPRDYAIESDWLVVRTADTESRVSLKRAVDLIITPTVSFLDCGEFAPVLLPFGSASEDAGQRAFLDALRSQFVRHETA